MSEQPQALLGIYRGSPAIFCPVTGTCVIVFRASAHGWSRAIKLAVELARELRS